MDDNEGERAKNAARFAKLRNELIGLGGGSHRKSYFPELSRRLSELEHFRKLIDSIEDSILVIDPCAGRITDLTARTAERLGWTREEVIGLSADQVLVGLALDTVAAAALPSIEGELRHRDGTTMPVEMNVQRSIVHREPVIVVVARDVTERIVAEKRQQELQEQLFHAQRMESLGILAGGIAHDFNNVLMGIMGAVSLLEDEVSPGGRPDLSRITDFVHSASNLTSQLLGFARGGAYCVEFTDINVLVRAQLELYARTHKGLTCARELALDLGTVEVDVTQIEQVLLNLLVNAGHAMPEGGRLWIRTRNVHREAASIPREDAETGDFVCLEVEDTGHGMDEETKAHIFDPFFTTKDRDRGTGLGLASAHGIVSNYRGWIEVRSAPGQGTTFSIYLPSVQAPPLRKQPVVAPPVSKGYGTVLLVDDEKSIRTVLRRVLSRRGYEVVEAEDGASALNHLEVAPQDFDLIVLDMVMPGVGGAPVFARIRALRPELPVLLCSGYAVDEQIRSLLDQGRTAFLQKPFHPRVLAQSIEELLFSE